MQKRYLIPALFVATVCLASFHVGISAQEASNDSPAKAQPTEAAPAKAQPIEDGQPTEAKPIAPAKATPTTATTSVRPLSVTVGLVSDNEIEGTLTDTTQLQMQTSFGTASIPLSEVAGIRFASANDATTTVVMLNGDSITGATDVKLITVETEWGTASINGPSVASIMFVPGLTWNPQSGLNGKRWSLSDQKSETSPAPATSAPTAPPRSTNSAPQNNSFPSQNIPAQNIPRSNNGQPFFPR